MVTKSPLRRWPVKQGDDLGTTLTPRRWVLDTLNGKRHRSRAASAVQSWHCVKQMKMRVRTGHRRRVPAYWKNTD